MKTEVEDRARDYQCTRTVRSSCKRTRRRVSGGMWTSFPRGRITPYPSIAEPPTGRMVARAAVPAADAPAVETAPRARSPPAIRFHVDLAGPLRRPSESSRAFPAKVSSKPVRNAAMGCSWPSGRVMVSKRKPISPARPSRPADRTWVTRPSKRVPRGGRIVYVGDLSV